MRHHPRMRQTVTPYLCVKGAEKAICFYSTVFGAKELVRYPGEDGRIGHVTFEIFGAQIFMADEYPEINVLSPETLGGSAVSIHLYVDDVDAVIERARAAGGIVTREPADQSYGDRNAKFTDPFGHGWMIASPLQSNS